MIVVTTLVAMTMVVFIVSAILVMSIMAFVPSSSNTPEAPTRCKRGQQHECEYAFHLNSNHSPHLATAGFEPPRRTRNFE